MRVFHQFSTICRSIEKNVIIEKKMLLMDKKKILIEFIGYIWFPKSNKERKKMLRKNVFFVWFYMKNMKKEKLNIIKINYKIHIF